MAWPPESHNELEHALAGGHLFTGGQQICMWFDDHIQSTCFKQWHSVISSITDNQGDPKDHPEEIAQKEYPPVAKTEWKNFHSIGKSILTTWSGTRILL